MRRRFLRGPVAILCVAILAIAMCGPAGPDLFAGLLEPVWILFAPAAVVIVRRRPEPSLEQPITLLTFDSGRAPPAITALT